MLVLVFGLPGTGKTFLAKELASELNLIHVNTDITRKKILSRPGYTHKEKEMVYDKLFEFLSEYLNRGENLVVDGTFYKEEYRAKLRAIAREANTKPAFIELTAKEEIIEARMLERAKQVCDSDADFSVYQKIKSEFEPLAEKHLKIDSSVPLLKQVEQVRYYLTKEGLL